MKEISVYVAEKLIFKETRKRIADNYLNKDSVIISPYGSAGEYARNLKVSAIEKSITKLSKEYLLPEEILETYFEYINWPIVIVEQIVSEEFIDNFREEIDWLLVCKYQELSETFIKSHLKYIDKSCLEVIWQTQTLSDKFIATHQHELPIFEKDSRMSKEFPLWWSSRTTFGIKGSLACLLSLEDIRNNQDNRAQPEMRAQNQAQSHISAISNPGASYWNNVPNISDERRAEMKARADERAASDAILAQQQARQMLEFNERKKEENFRSIIGRTGSFS